MDVDNDLLLQFTCLGTTDRDDLVKQFKELTQVTEDEKAEFFLEMNNWNLQNSLWAYFDFLAPTDLSMIVVQQPPSYADLAPNIDFVMVFTLRNDGRTTWPQGCFLSSWSRYGNFPFDKTFPVDAVEPGCCTSAILSFTAPAEPGSYHSTLRLMTPSHMCFGRVISFSFQVHAKLEDTEEQRLSDELTSRMALMDSAESKIMEEDTNTESLDDLPDYSRTDHNIS